MKNLDGVIFDVDGTLLDSMYVWKNAGPNYLKSKGIDTTGQPNKVFKAMTLLQAAQHYQEEYGIKESTDEIIAGIYKGIEKYYFDDVILKDGVADFLQKLYSDNVKMCIATATDRYLIEAAFKRLGISHYFSQIFTSSEVGIGKSNPKIYFKALEHLQTKKENTLVFEDALYAIKTAKKADFKVVGVYDKFESDSQDIIKEIADFYINSFGELDDVLKSF